MSEVIDLDSSDEDNGEVEVTETTTKVVPQAGPKMCLNPMGQIAKSHGFLKEFVDLINLCFKFESTKGMERILKRNLIPNYKELDYEYAKSDKLKSFLKNIFKKLKNEPYMKFTYLREVSEHFKANKIKKKVNFVTLNTKVSDKFKRYYNMQNEKSNNKKLDNVISSDENEHPCPQIINLDDDINDAIDLESCENTNNVNKIPQFNNKDVNKSTCDKSNDTITENHEDRNKKASHKVYKKKIAHTNIVVDSDSDGNMDHTNNIADNDCESLSHTNSMVDSDCEMVQSEDDTIDIDHTAENINTGSKEIVEIRNDIIPAINNNYKTTMESGVFNNDLLNIPSARTNAEHVEISYLESEIRTLKHLLIEMEESEVLSDGFNSPYFEAHKTKLLIIQKYKKLCELRGETYKPRKCRQFQLKVKEGHPAGPARKLEEWLNSNMDKDGEPSFPNLRDVIKCVWVANQEGNLGWDINRSYQEARILFTQCGQHLQRRRQQREWRDLLQTARTSVDQDPADSDPELLAKLEANRELARVKFEGIVDHYAKLEEDSRKPMKRIKISNVKSLSNTNPQSPCWEVPITGLIKITSIAPNENQTGSITDIKQENSDECDNNTQEFSDQVDNINETSKSNVCKLALNFYNSVMEDNSITMKIDTQEAAEILQYNKNSLKNSQQLNNTENTKTISLNSHKNKSMSIDNGESMSNLHGTLEQNYKLSSPEMPKIVSYTSDKSEPVLLNEPKPNDKLLPDVDRNSIATPSQTEINKRNCLKNIERDVLATHNEKSGCVEKRIDSQATMETDVDAQNIMNQSESMNVIENAQTIDKNNTTERTNNDSITGPNTKNEIKREVKMEVDFSEEDFDLLFDKNFSCDTAYSARVFDVEDTVEIIELTSSDSESDSDDCQLITL